MNEEEAIEILKDIEIIDFYNNYSEYTFPEKEVKEKFEAIETVLNLLKKKDKIIDKMSQEILYKEPLKYNNIQEVKQYFERKVENGN